MTDTTTPDYSLDGSDVTDREAEEYEAAVAAMTTTRQPIPVDRLIRSAVDDSGDYDDSLGGRTGGTWDPATGVLTLRYERDETLDANPGGLGSFADDPDYQHGSAAYRFALVRDVEMQEPEPRLANGLHDPDLDAREGDYALVAAVIIEAFNPADDDASEEGILTDAVYAARDYISAQPCTCTDAMVEDCDPCRRCAVLGRLANEVQSR